MKTIHSILVSFVFCSLVAGQSVRDHPFGAETSADTVQGIYRTLRAFESSKSRVPGIAPTMNATAMAHYSLELSVRPMSMRGWQLVLSGPKEWPTFKSLSEKLEAECKTNQITSYVIVYGSAEETHVVFRDINGKLGHFRSKTTTDHTTGRETIGEFAPAR